MSENHEPVVRRGELAPPPPVYEIRVKGRLDSGHWAEWFDGMTVMVDDSGETVLRGPVIDQSALYGLLSRLRDLALPLVSVHVLEESAGGWFPPTSIRRRKGRWSQINWLLILVYLLLVGGLSGLTVFLTSDLGMDTALALTLLFAAAGGIAYGCYRVDGGRWWLVMPAFAWPGAVITLFIYLMTAGWLPTALGVTLLCLFLGGGLLYLLYRRQGVQGRVVSSGGERSNGVVVRWEKLGTVSQRARRDDLSPAERDVPPGEQP